MDIQRVIADPIQAEGTMAASDLYVTPTGEPPEVSEEPEEEESPPRDWSWVREWASNLMEIVGVLVVSYGFFLIKPWAGVICLGVGLILVGMAVSRPSLRTVDEGDDEVQAWQMGPT